MHNTHANPSPHPIPIIPQDPQAALFAHQQAAAARMAQGIGPGMPGMPLPVCVCACVCVFAFVCVCLCVRAHACVRACVRM